MASVNKGVQWLASLQACEIAVQSVMKVVLAWLLAPDDFGVIGGALLLSGFAQATSQTGVVAALIQRKNITSDHLNAGWTIEVFRGFLLFAIIYLLSPYYVFYMTDSINDDYVSLIRLVGLTVFLESSKNIGIIFFDKTVNFKKVFILQITALLSKTLFTLIFCFYLRNYWGIAYGMLAGSLTLFFLSYVLSEYVLKISFDVKRMKDLMSFGVWVFLYTLVGFAILKLPDFIILKEFGFRELGILQMAIFLGMIFRNTISEIQNRIIFPLASAYQEDGEKLKELYVTSVNIALFIYLPSGFGIGFISADLVAVLFDDEWFEVGQLLSILAVAGIFGSLTRTIEQLYKGSGAAKEIFVFCLVSLFLLGYFSYFIVDRSLVGVCQSILAASIAHFLMITIHSWYKFGIGMDEFKITAPLIVSAVTTMILVLAFVDNLDLVVGYQALFAKIVIGTITYGAVIFALFWWFNRSILKRTLIYFRINP